MSPVHLLRAGSRTEAALLLHGFTGSSACWRAVAAAAGGRGAIFGLDLPGHRGEVMPLEPRPFTELVDGVAREVEALGLEGAHVAGYSLGGRVALALLVMHPGLFARATLIGASPGLEDATARAERRASDEVWARRLELEGIEAFALAWEAQPVLQVVSAVPEERLDAQRAERRRHGAAGLAFALRSLGLGAMPDLGPCLCGVEVPVALVTGEADAKFRAIADEMAVRLPSAERVVVPGVGHNVPLERPAAIAARLS